MSEMAWELTITWGVFLLFCVGCALYQKRLEARMQWRRGPMSEPRPVAEHILISAVRYALGRQTYIVPMTVQEVLRLWPELTAETRGIIRRDVTDALPRCSDMDQREWQRIVELRL